MKFAEDHNRALYKITAYEKQGVAINGLVHHQPLILSPMKLINDWAPTDFATLKVEHLAALYALKPEVILLGTGNQQIFPDKNILRYFVSKGIGYEIMDTQAACRTFNILMSEDRTVVAGLFP